MATLRSDTPVTGLFERGFAFMNGAPHYYSLYTQKMVNFMKVWGVASEDVGSRDCCRQAPMEGFTAVLDRHIPY
ncbi:MAG: hypothetical protein Q7U98_08120, partial [Methylicorpusculum sp.]|uniref:hypothetical protein n=1 Tax=Methylicorpusculum sp. TaxID=2713644 RepID=UPI0027207DB9